MNRLVSRRAALKGASAATLMTAGGLTLSLPAGAVPKKKTTQVPGYYRFTHGDFEVTVLSDGSYLLPTTLMATNVPREKVVAFLKANYLSTTERTSHVNIPLINTGKDLILVDVGGGPNWMETAGKLTENLEASGYSAEDVTKVIITHGHPDHIWGLFDEFEEAPSFPNADYVIAENEWGFWSTDKAMSELPEMFKGFAVGAKKHLTPIANKVTRIKPGAEIAPGIMSVNTPGHTVGHMSLMVSSQGENLLVTGDTVTHPYVSFEHPDWWSRTDFDAKQAEKSRRTVLDMATSEKALILAYHLSFPGLGRVAKTGNSHRFIPETWQWQL